MELFQFHSQFVAQFCVQVSTRVRRKENVDSTHQGTPDRHALTLAAGKGCRIALKQIVKMKQ